MSPASASAMVKRLESMGLVEHEPYHGVKLTPAGERVALEVLRHHRLLELYLAEALGMSWDRVHEEAEVLEHAISPALLGADRRQARQPHARPARRPDPHRRRRDRRGAHARPRRPRARARAACSCACPTPTRTCCATSPSAGSRPAIASRCSSASRSRARSPSLFARALARARRRAHRRRCGPSRVSEPLEAALLRGAARRSLLEPVPGAARAERAGAAARAAAACATAWPCSARRSWRPWPTSTPATSPPTSPAAPSTATCCCGSCSRPT